MALNPPRSKQVYEFDDAHPNGRYVTKFDDDPPPAAPAPIVPVAPFRGVGGGTSSTATDPTAPLPPGSLLDVTRNVGGIPGVNRITNPAQPHAAPLFTNIADTGTAVRGIYAEPGISADSLNRTLATSSVFNAPADPLLEARHAAAGRGDFRAVDRSYRTDEQQTAYELDQAHGAVARGITNSLRNGVPAKIFPEMMAGLGALDTASAKGAPDAGDYAALLNAQTAQQQLGVAQAREAREAGTAASTAATNARNAAVSEGRLTQSTANAADRRARQSVNDIAKISVDSNGVFNQELFKQNLVQFGPTFGFGGTSASGGMAEVDAGIAKTLRDRGVSEAEIQQHLARRAGNAG